MKPDSEPRIKTPLREPDHQFFHRKHAVTTFWALVAAAVSALAMAYWQNRQGPQRVYVTNPDTTVRIVTVGDTAMRQYLETMIRELRQLRISTFEPSRPSVSPASSNHAVPVLDFKFASSVKGYLEDDLGKIGRATCPRGQFPPNSDIPVSIRLSNASLVPKLSPLFVSVEHRDRPTVTTLIFEEQFEPMAVTDLVVPAPSVSGTYDLVFGYYPLSGLNTAYPRFYRSSCRIKVA